MKKTIITFMALALCVGAFAQTEQKAEQPKPAKEKGAVAKHLNDHFKIYGFIRNYFTYDSREGVGGTGDLYYWFPKDVSLNAQGEDMNAISSFRYLSISTRVGLDVFGYEWKGYNFGAKVEADFYAGLEKSPNQTTGTATLRLRQAYATVAKNWRDWKIGQAWHPMAADMPDIYSLETGVPFGPFSRTPQVTFNAKLGKGFSITASALWQMQYTSTGPGGASANYIKYSCTPEGYLGFNFQNDKVLVRLGGDILSIKPYNFRSDVAETDPNYQKKVSDRITTFNVFQYGQFKFGNFTWKEKITYANDGSHFNLIGGYGVSGLAEDNVSYTYSATRMLAAWTTLKWQKKDCNWVPSILLGYLDNFGTPKAVNATECWCKNSATSIAQMYRIQPAILYNMGKFQIGLEYMYTAAEYGKTDKVWMHPTDNLHWVGSHRVQAMIKFNF